MSYNNGILTLLNSAGNSTSVIGGLVNPLFIPPSGQTWTNTESLSIAGSFTSVSGSSIGSVYGLSLTPVATTNGAGSVGTFYGAYIQPASLISGGTGSPTANTYAVFIDTVSVQNTGNAYGLYIQTPSGASVTNLSAYFTTAPLFGTPLGLASGGTSTSSFGATISSVVYFNGTSPSPVPAGTVGQYFLSTGFGTAPSFQNSLSLPLVSLLLSGTITVTPPTAIVQVSTNFLITNPTVTANLYDILANSTFTPLSGNIYTNVYGLKVAPNITASGTGALTNVWGIQSAPTLNLTGTGTATQNAYGLQVAGTYTAANGTSIGTLYGATIFPDLVTSGTGSIGTLYGLYLNASSAFNGTGATTNYAYGLYIDALNTQRTNSAYGLEVNTPTSGALNFNAFFNGTGSIGFGANPSLNSYLLIAPPLVNIATTTLVSITSIFSQGTGASYGAFNNSPQFALASTGTTTVSAVYSVINQPLISPTSSSGTLTISNGYALQAAGTILSPGNTTLTNVADVAGAQTITTSGTGSIGTFSALSVTPLLNLAGTGTGPSATYGLQIGGTILAGNQTSIGALYGASFAPLTSTSGTGSIGTFYGAYIKPTSTNSGGGTTTSYAFGLYIDSVTVANTNAAYGLYVNSPTGAASNYGAVINSFSTSSGLFGLGLGTLGSYSNIGLGIGTLTPNYTLDVQGRSSTQVIYTSGTLANNEKVTLFEGSTQGGFGGGSVGTQKTMSQNTTLYFDTKANVNSNSLGFEGGVFDGRYVYLVPNNSAFTPYSGQITRYDTTLPFSVSTSYAIFDTKTYVNSNSCGFEGGVFDGRYIYLVPNYTGVIFSGQITRYDTTLPFGVSISYAIFDTKTNVNGNSCGFAGGVFDGRYVYFAPNNNGINYFGQITRYDTTLPFTLSSSYAVFDTMANVNSNSGGFFGGVFDGRYVYFVSGPNSTGSVYLGQITRYDTTLSFVASTSYSVFDTKTYVNSNSLGFQGLIFDGRYVYLIPFGNTIIYSGQITRYDTTLPFGVSTSYAVYDTKTYVNSNSCGFVGGVFDGRYTYFAPSLTTGAAVNGQITRYDTTRPFSVSSSYTVFNTAAGNANSVGFQGAVFDGRYVYLVPNFNTGVASGLITRIDAYPGPQATSMDASQAPHGFSIGLFAGIAPLPNGLLVSGPAGFGSSSPTTTSQVFISNSSSLITSALQNSPNYILGTLSAVAINNTSTFSAPWGTQFISTNNAPNFSFAGGGTTTIASVYSSFVNPTFAPTDPLGTISFILFYAYNIEGTFTFPGNTAVTNFYTANVSPSISTTGTGTLGTFYGLNTAPSVSLTGTGGSTTAIYNLSVTPSFTLGSSGLIGNAYGLNLSPNVSTSGTGSIQNFYGLSVTPTLNLTGSIGTTNNAYSLFLGGSFSSDSGTAIPNVYGLSIAPTITGNIANFIGMNIGPSVALSGPGTTPNTYGLLVQGAYTANSGTTLTQVSGTSVMPQIYLKASGVVSNATGVSAGLAVTAPNGTTVGNAYGVYINNVAATNTTNAYGLYVETPSGASVSNICAQFQGVIHTPSSTGGIQFDEPAGGSVTAAVLNHYIETGTWTPQIAGTAPAGTPTYSTQVGYFHRIGNIIFLSGVVGATSIGTAGGVLLVNNLPYPVANILNYAPVLTIRADSLAWPAAAGYLSGQFQTNSTQIRLNQSRSATANSSVTVSTAVIYFSGFYLT